MKKLISILFIFLIITIFCGAVFASSGEGEKTTIPFPGGNGTKESPYIVSTATDIMNISNYLNCYFVQVGDISFEDEEHVPIGSYEKPFTGNYNGNGFSINNISFESKDIQYSGLFGYSKGTIANVKLKKCLFSLSSNTKTLYCGAVAGYNYGEISSCTVDAVINVSTKGERLSAFAGGVCGFSTQILKNCSFYGEVTSIVNYVDSSAYSGGIVAEGGAQNCANHGNITSISSVSSDAYAGGIVAITIDSIENCYNDGDIAAKNAKTAYAGGITGKNGDSIESCKNDGSVYANTKYSYSETYSGGISGRNRATISFCENGGDINAGSTSSNVRVGGIAGYNDSTVQDCKNYGNISGFSTSYESHAGGIAGTAGASSSSYVRRCCNYGKVITTENGPYSLGSAGGIVGLLQYGKTLQCCNHGEVLGIQKADKLSCYVGGVVGGTSGSTIIDCYNTGKVSMDYKGDEDWSAGACGGIYGESDSTCSFCYNVGELTVTSEHSKIGGIQGLGNSADANVIEYCYALNVYDDPYAIEMSDEESKIKETYVGFDFENVWATDSSVNNGRPYLATVLDEDNENWYSNNNFEISFASNNIKIRIGKERTLFVNTELESEDLLWTTSNSDIVTVEGEVITAIAKGTAIITVSSADDTCLASCIVTVVDEMVISGDATGDDDVNNRDAARILQYIAGWDVEIEMDAADVNGDGKVNNRDAARILQFVAGWDVELV